MSVANRESASSPARPVRAGELITYKDRTRVMIERYRDDGDRVISDIEAGTERWSIAITRSTRTFEFTKGEHIVQRKVIPEGTVALENGHWAAYSVAATWFSTAQADTPIKVWLPRQDLTLDATIRVSQESDGRKLVILRFGGLEVQTSIAADGVVTHATVVAQRVEVRTSDAGAPPFTKRESPPAADSIDLDLDRGSFHLRGELWRPKDARARTPVVLFVAGSGPTDRDGNNATGLRTDLYRQLASALIERGVSSVRYDKRGVGGSGDPSLRMEPVLDDFASDIVAIVRWLRVRDDVERVYIAGHSEGALLALVAAQKTSIDGAVLLAGPGRTIATLLKEQVTRTEGAETAAKLERIYSALRAGDPPAEIPESLQALFRPTANAAWRSMLDVDPIVLARGFTKPLAIVQGAMDQQVTVDDAKRLKAAAPAATLLIIPNANHVLKVETSRDGDQASYHDPDKPIAPGVVDVIVALTKSVRR